MATTVFELETNKNAVIFYYPHVFPYGPAYEGEKPSGCVVRFHGYSINTTIYEKGFRVFKNSENMSKLFPTLREAREFVIGKVNKKLTLFERV